MKQNCRLSPKTPMLKNKHKKSKSCSWIIWNDSAFNVS